MLSRYSVLETGKARLPTAERLNGGTASWLEEADIFGFHFKKFIQSLLVK